MEGYGCGLSETFRVPVWFEDRVFETLREQGGLTVRQYADGYDLSCHSRSKRWPYSHAQCALGPAARPPTLPPPVATSV